MKHHVRYYAQVTAIVLATLFSSSCSAIGGGKLGAAACPALRPTTDALSAHYSAQAHIDAKVKTFVQAAKDLAAVSQQIEATATQACLRIGADIGLSPAQMRAKDGPGGAASGACEAVAAQINAILRQGIVLRATVQPPQCQASAQAHARCSAACNVQADAECNASCRAHANVHATCTPAVVTVQATQGAHLAGRLVASLQANLPQLIHAQITLGQRLIEDAKVVAQVGVQLPKIVGQAGAQALACIAAAADAAASASIRIQVSVRASASVSAQAGASAG